MESRNQIDEINRAHKALTLLKHYDHQHDDGWPYITVGYHGICNMAYIEFFYVRGCVRRAFEGDTFDDGLDKLEVLINERGDHDEVPF